MPDFSPREIVSELDKHIVGQQDAKRAVAIALRNRWRRLQLPEALREEVLPKNILMIGPTGCGKTEIARRLAKLANAPFLKVEATKFTEVGYVGRDVDQIAHDAFHVPADIADFGELGRLDLHERRVRQFRQPAGDLGLADAGRADHENVLRRDFLPQWLIDLHPAPAVTQSDRHGALGGILPDNVLVELLNDLAGSQR